MLNDAREQKEDLEGGEKEKIRNTPLFSSLCLKGGFLKLQTPLWLRHSDWPWVIRFTPLPLFLCAPSLSKVVITIAWLWQPNYLWNDSDFMPSHWAGPLCLCMSVRICLKQAIYCAERGTPAQRVLNPVFWSVIMTITLQVFLVVFVSLKCCC